MNRALRAATIGVLLFTPVALSACSAGQINQTSTQNRDKYGAQALIGDLVIRDAALAFPGPQGYAAGDDAELTLVIANPGLSQDKLVSITGADFQGVRVAGTGRLVTAGASAQATGCIPLDTVPGTSSGSGAATSTGTTAASSTTAATGSGAATSTGAAGTTTATGAAGSTTSAARGATGSSATRTGAVSTGSINPSAGAAAGSIPTVLNTTSPLTTAPTNSSQIGVVIPAGCDVSPGQNIPHIFLTNLTRPLSNAAIVPITMTFQRAGTVTVPFIVSPPNDVLPRTSTYNFNQGGPGGGLGENKPQEGAAHGG